MSKKTAPTPHSHETHQHSDETPAAALIAKNTVVTVTIPWEKAEPFYKKARSKVASTVKIAGFRKGKVPPDVAEKMLGSADIIEKALEEILPDVYLKTIQKEKKQPLTQPAFRGVSLEVGKDWVIEAEIAEKPEIQLGEYKKFVSEARSHVTKELEAREKELATAKKETPDEKSDEATKKPAESGKKAAPMSDEQKKDLTLQHIYQHLIAGIKPQIPELLVRREVEYDIEQLGTQLQSLNLKFQDYLERRGISQDTLTQQMAMSALGRLQLLFIVDKIAQEQKFEVKDSAIDTYLEEKIEKSIRDQYKSSAEYRGMVSQTLLRQQVAEHLLAL